MSTELVGMSNYLTELRISNLQEPILSNNEIENIDPNCEESNKLSEKELLHSKADSTNSLFSSDIKISFKTELFKEIEKNNLKKVKEIINKDISQINDYNIDGLTPLHLGIIKGNINIINLLLENGSNPNALSLSKNQSPLHFSYLNQNENSNEIIRNLIKHGAKENLLDINHKKPSDYLNFNVNISNSNLNSNNSNNKRITLNKKTLNLNSSNSNEINDNNINGMNDSQISKKNISELHSYDTTIINSLSSQKENKSFDDYNKISIEDPRNLKINLNDLITPIKYPCLSNLKEDKSSINDSLEIENININLNNKNIENNSLLLHENDIKNYQSIHSNTSYNDNIDMTYTTSMIVDQSNIKRSSSKKENINNSNQNTSDIKKIFINIKNKNNCTSKCQSNDDLYRQLILKKRDVIAKTYRKKSNKIYCNSTYYGRTEKNKNKKIYQENQVNINKINSIWKNITNSNIVNSKYLNKTIAEYSPFSTDCQSCKKNWNKREKGNNINIIENKAITEFKYDNSISEGENNRNINITIASLANEFINNSNNLKTIDELNNNYNEINNWLTSINLQNYYDYFVNNNIYDINQFINKMKNYQTRLKMNDIESLFKLDKKGYNYRILVKLEVDAGLIDSKISKFMIKNFNTNKSHNRNTSNLKLSISQDFINCFGFCKCNFFNSSKINNDLKCFLLRYGLMDLYQNFYHNGFDLINYVILQMYSDCPINEDILENSFHIYNYEKRERVLEALLSEMEKINIFLNSIDYNNSPNKEIIKYENIIFDKQDYNNIYSQKTKKICNDCFIF